MIRYFVFPSNVPVGDGMDVAGVVPKAGIPDKTYSFLHKKFGGMAWP